MDPSNQFLHHVHGAKSKSIQHSSQSAHSFKGDIMNYVDRISEEPLLSDSRSAIEVDPKVVKQDIENKYKPPKHDCSQHLKKPNNFKKNVDPIIPLYLSKKTSRRTSFLVVPRRGSNKSDSDENDAKGTDDLNLFAISPTVRYTQSIPSFNAVLKFDVN